MSDNFWEDIKDILYDATENEFYTDEERNAIIEDSFSSFAGFSDNVADIAGNFRSRQHTFYSPVDLVFWVEDAGIPIEYVWVHRHTSLRDGSYAYNAYVSNSP